MMYNEAFARTQPFVTFDSSQDEFYYVYKKNGMMFYITFGIEKISSKKLLDTREWDFTDFDATYEELDSNFSETVLRQNIQRLFLVEDIIRGLL